ncbi:hypothetical protein [Sphingomonas sp. CCH5-D11]|uniref:hypothetical protein n=1 Tax=Sphingomonas sp. CCH5-D11 TaxID=1768786 RepID=UPI000833D85F|nr:hypothetical protein [Sphingomonas sp. CCH5-D11]
MPDWLISARVLTLLIEAAGLYFLTREILVAQKTERIGAGLESIKRIRDAIQQGDWRASVLEILLDSPATARFALSTYKTYSLQECKNIALRWDSTTPDATEVSARWHHLTEQAVYQWRAKLLVIGVFCAFLALVAGGALDLFEPEERAPPVVSGSGTKAPALFAASAAIRFGDGEASIPIAGDGSTADGVRSVCAIKRELQSRHLRSAVVIGRADQRDLSAKLAQRFSSNIGLAQARANAVAAYLREPRFCGPALSPVIPLVAGPSHIGRDNRSPASLAEDRTVSVYGLDHDVPASRVRLAQGGR